MTSKPLTREQRKAQTRTQLLDAARKVFRQKGFLRATVEEVAAEAGLTTNADGTDLVQLTNNSVPDLTATWAPDGQQIVFHRFVARQGLQLFTVKPMLNADGTLPTPTQRTFPPGLNLLANWGELRVRNQEPAQ